MTNHPDKSEMTLRDQFAMAALTGLLSDSHIKPEPDSTFEEFAEETASACYDYADAMLKARESSQ